MLSAFYQKPVTKNQKQKSMLFRDILQTIFVPPPPPHSPFSPKSTGIDQFWAWPLTLSPKLLQNQADFSLLHSDFLLQLLQNNRGLAC